MLLAIDYSTDTGNITNGEHHADAPAELPPVPQGCARLTADMSIEDEAARTDDLLMRYYADAQAIRAKIPAPDPLPMAKEAAVAAIASHRYIREVGGFDYMGKRVMSDRESQAKIQGLMTGVQLMGDAFRTAWKCEDGWLDLDKAAAVGLVAAALQHVSGLYVREAAFAGYIVEATTVEAIDNILREF